MTKLSTCLAACALAACAAQGADLKFLKELVEIPSSSIDYPQVNRATRAMKAYLESRGLFCTVETAIYKQVQRLKAINKLHR